MTDTKATTSLNPVDAEWAARVRRLAGERDAVILAHNYQRPEIQEVADHVGDSLALARLAASSSASVIVLCGVYFMAETAKILSPERTVLIPDAGAGCSLADSITADQLRAWKAEHPGAAVVAYVNTSAEVKAESDVCCTSANAAEVVSAIPADREVLFLPDQFLGAHVKRVTGRSNLRVWAGECHVHAGISPQALRDLAAARPEAELYVHPECGCGTSALWQTGTGDLPSSRTRILSTGGMLDGRAHDPRVRGPGGDRDRDAAPAAQGQPRGFLRAGQPARDLPLHEDDHGRGAGTVPAHRADRGARRPVGRRPRPPRGRGHDRHRPGSRPGRRVMAGARWRRDADVVVVGSGAAGIAVALTAAARGLRVLVVTKDLVGGATPLAQGGLAAALGAGDTPAAHVRDTLVAGAGLCEPDIVAALADGAPGAIELADRARRPA